MMRVVLAALFTTGCVAAWPHGWGTGSLMTFADFNPPTLLTDEQARFVVDKWKIVSLEKCTGIGSGVKTEEAIYRTAQQLKAIDPNVKVLFYLHTGFAGGQCYALLNEWAQRSDLWLHDDHGNVVWTQAGVAQPDFTNPAARAFWAAVPLGGINGTGLYNNTPVSQLIDGVLADGVGYGNIPNVSVARLEALADAKAEAVAVLQASFTTANGGVVMGNGISMYGGVNADPRAPEGHNLNLLNVMGGIMNEHTAVFESVNAANASLNVGTVTKNLEAVVNASQEANGTKVVALQTWPGLYVNTNFWPRGSAPASCYPPQAAGGEPTPQNSVEWQAALRRHFTFAYATFLTIAEPNVYFFYGGVWYPSTTGIIACPEDPTSCPAPPEWYPDLLKPLGVPLGPRQPGPGPYQWTRQFEHAAVFIDLMNTTAATVTFASA